MTAVAYADKHMYGQYYDESDDENELSPTSKRRVVDATPQTKRRLLSQHDLEKAGKIGPLKTFFTLFKGFVATGVLFIPKGFRNGGWLFSTIALT